MKAAKNIEAIWDKTKAGCKYPFTLKIRLTDGDGYAGSLILADLLFPWCTVPRAGIPPSLKRSFAALSMSDVYVTVFQKVSKCMIVHQVIQYGKEVTAITSALYVQKIVF